MGCPSRASRRSSPATTVPCPRKAGGLIDEASTWDGLAGRYDTIVRLFDRSYPAIGQRLARDLRGRGRVLEVAAGTGQFTAELAKAADHVVATDVSPQMVERLGARVREAGLTNVEAEVMSAYQLSAGDGTFDGVFCANALHVMEHPADALAEFRRVLALDGLLVVPTFLHGTDWVRRAISRSLTVVSSFVAHTRLDLAGLEGLVEAGGFVVERSERLPGVFPVGYVVGRVPK